MLVKGYHIQRLKPEVEETIRRILREGSENVVQILHEHFKDFVPEDSEKFFGEVLVQIAKTVSKVASLPELNFDQTRIKRVAFLPGYTTKKKKRVAHKVKFEKKYIPSDIVFNILGKEKIERVKDTVTNQALLYYYLLEHHEGDNQFINGGTHQFLITNAPELKTNSKYHLDLLQVFTGKKKANPDDEITFLTIEVDFKKLNTIEKLYNHFDKILNEGDLDLKWPLSIYDRKGDFEKNPNTYKMRGYLVSLWYKILHDSNRTDIPAWIKECINLAELSEFLRLKERLEKLQKALTDNQNEFYSFWYSLVYNHLPDFTAPDAPIKETLGSAMLMTNFELRPQFFFWVQPWIDGVYRNIRDFENLERLQSEVIEEITIAINQGNDHFPVKVSGQRWLKADEMQRHKLPLYNYYEDYFSSENSANHLKPFAEATEMLNCIALIRWIDEIGSEGDSTAMRTQFVRQFGGLNTSKEYGSMLENLEGNQRRATRTLFSHRLTGRTFALGCYLYLGFSMKLIHAILVGKKLADEEMVVKPETPHRMLRQAFFIYGLSSDDTEDGRNLCVKNICENLSLYEKLQLKAWWYGYEGFISENITDQSVVNSFMEKLKKLEPPIL